jgi:secondary thiamine-phosphate synthase enzyme
MRHTLTIPTHAREQLVDITAQVQEAVSRSGVRDGLAVVFSTHTTAGITINENADPDVPRDMLHWLKTRIPQNGEFRHGEGNADAHLKTSLFGISQTIIVDEGRLSLGTWQGVFLAEFDGPRTRKVLVKLIPTT